MNACFKSKDYLEGRDAFMEKRKPVFTGTSQDAFRREGVEPLHPLDARESVATSSGRQAPKNSDRRAAARETS